MFVQVGQQAINMNLVSDITFGDDVVELYFSDGDDAPIRFMGSERDAFLEWWFKKADVYVCYVEGE